MKKTYKQIERDSIFFAISTICLIVLLLFILVVYDQTVKTAKSKDYACKVLTGFDNARYETMQNKFDIDNGTIGSCWYGQNNDVGIEFLGFFR